MSNVIKKPYIPPFVTFGLPPKGAKVGPYNALVTMGATPGITYTPPKPNLVERETGAELSTDQLLNPGNYTQNVIRNEAAFSSAIHRIVAANSPLRDLSNPQADFDIATLSPLDSEPFSYTGSDLRVFIDVPGTPGKQLLELATITVSVHREKSPVRAVGYINPKGFARGRRTIAGTMILTQFHADTLYRFLDRKWNQDMSKDNPYKKPDQLPPFNVTFLFADELGHASYRRMLGVDAVTDGTVYSSQDQITEQTVSFMAADFTPLLPIDTSPMTMPDLGSSSSSAQKTPLDARREDLLNLPSRVADLSLAEPDWMGSWQAELAKR